MFRFMVSKNKDQTILYQRYLSKGIHFLQGCINRPRIGEDFSSETSLPSFPHIGNVGITRKTMESTAELILCGS